MALSQVKMTMREKPKINTVQTEQMKTPKNAAEARKILDNASISPTETLTWGVIVCAVIALLLWGMLSPNFSLFELLIYFIGSLLVVGGFGIRTIPTAQHGVITLFNRRLFEDLFENGQKSILGEGTHWVLPFFCGVKVVDTREKPVNIPNTEQVVPNPQNRKTGITVVFENGRLNFVVYHPFKVLNTRGLKVIADDLVETYLETVRDESTSIRLKTKEEKEAAALKGEVFQENGPELIFSADMDKKILKRLRGESEDDEDDTDSESDTERWGVLPLSAKVVKIAFGDPEAKKAFHYKYIEDREQESEAIQMDTVLKNFNRIKKRTPEMPDTEAWLTAQRMSKGVLRDSDITISGNQGSNSDLIPAAVIIANSNKQKPQDGNKDQK